MKMLIKFSNERDFSGCLIIIVSLGTVLLEAHLLAGDFIFTFSPAFCGIKLSCWYSVLLAVGMILQLLYRLIDPEIKFAVSCYLINSLSNLFFRGKFAKHAIQEVNIF